MSCCCYCEGLSILDYLWPWHCFYLESEHNTISLLYKLWLWGFKWHSDFLLKEQSKCDNFPADLQANQQCIWGLCIFFQLINLFLCIIISLFSSCCHDSHCGVRLHHISLWLVTRAGQASLPTNAFSSIVEILHFLRSSLTNSWRLNTDFD